jgi:hypothetical protein
MRLYTQSVLPLLGTPHYCSFQDEMKDVLALFVTRAPESCALPIATAILRFFPRSRACKAVAFVTLLAQVASSREVRPTALPVARLLARCAASEHRRLVEPLLPVWSHPNIGACLAQHAREIFPAIAPPMAKAADNTWSPDVRATIGRILGALCRLDPEAYEEAMKPDGARPPTAAVSDKRSTWAAVVGAAARTYPEFDVTQMMAELEKLFSGGHGQPTHCPPSSSGMVAAP